MNDFPKRLKIEVAFDVGEVVYIITDSDQSKYIVMGYYARPSELLYEVYCHGCGDYIAYEFELTREKTIE